MSTTLRGAAITVATAALLTVALAAIVLVSNRQPVIVTSPTATTTQSTVVPQVQTSGEGTVSKRPDLAIVSAGVQSDQSTAVAAQSDLAAKTSKLVARIKSLGVSDSDLSTVGYFVGPIYSSGGDTITSYRASEQLQVKWHNVDTVGKTLDAIVEEGGATSISVGFGFNDPKAAQAEARSLAVADAHSKAAAMASAAGVKLGQVLLVSDLGVSNRYPATIAYAGAAVAPTQVPVGQLDVSVSVEVDYAIG